MTYTEGELNVEEAKFIHSICKKRHVAEWRELKPATEPRGDHVNPSPFSSEVGYITDRWGVRAKQIRKNQSHH